MGGKSSKPEPAPAPSRIYTYQPPPTPPPTREPPVIYTPSLRSSYQPPSPRIIQPVYDDYDQLNEITRRLQSIRISREPTRSIEAPQRSRRNPELVDAYTTGVVTFSPLEPYEPEYAQITRMITKKQNFKVDSIERIDNPYLKKAYELKKQQKQKDFPYVEERLLFHGTKRANVGDICTMNFNWRLCKAHKYGKGVSFSPNSTYASVYSDELVHQKVMIVAKVLIGRSCIGNQFMELPPDGYDTTQKGDEGIVIVKFEDCEFCPVYKINYHVRDESVGKGRGYKRRMGRRGPQIQARPVFLYNDDLTYYYGD